MQVCPCCKKKQKNLILHIKKSSTCNDIVSEEEMKQLKDQSKIQRRQYMMKTMKERRRKAREEKTKEREDDKEPNKEDMIDTEENVLTIPKRCPICNTKKVNILLHIKTKISCFTNIDKQVFQKWRKIAKNNTQKAQNRKLRKIAKNNTQEAQNKKRREEKKESKSYETFKERQNRYKAKSREKARKNDHDAVKKYQREATAKCRIKQKEEDPELYKARQLMWNWKERPVTSHNLMRVPKKLLQNYHRLDKLYKDTDTYTEDEDVNGLTVSAQIKILNDKSMNDEEKKCKLESLWDKTDTRWKMGRQRWSSSSSLSTSSSSDEEEQEERE